MELENLIAALSEAQLMLDLDLDTG